ncbi:MAG: hypothetical protein JWQ63_499 [Mucilaginibacter sp.]|nr:hypothetical protein [Mucilaginibacter sp.]
MKNFLIILLTIFLINSLSVIVCKAQTSPVTMPSLEKINPWTENQLIEPAELAALINSSKSDMPVIFNIGAVEDIKGAKHIGAVSSAENMEKFKYELNLLQHNTEIIIYCGCCPFSKCPNIRPAFLELQKIGFTNIKLLNLPTNLKTNWTAKGYPLGSK